VVFKLEIVTEYALKFQIWVQSKCLLTSLTKLGFRWPQYWHINNRAPL